MATRKAKIYTLHPLPIKRQPSLAATVLYLEKHASELQTLLKPNERWAAKVGRSYRVYTELPRLIWDLDHADPEDEENLVTSIHLMRLAG